MDWTSQDPGCGTAEAGRGVCWWPWRAAAEQLPFTPDRQFPHEGARALIIQLESLSSLEEVTWVRLPRAEAGAGNGG